MFYQVGIKLQAGGLWIGAHYSKVERRWCINLIPCVTVFVVLAGGRAPRNPLCVFGGGEQ